MTAYSALTRHPNPTDLLPSLITAMLSNNEVSQLLSFPFPPALHPAIDAFLLKKAQSSSVEPHSPSQGQKYYEILSTWRLRHQDFRAAAEALLQRNMRLQTLSAKAEGRGDGAESVLEGFLAVINLLACAGEEWLLCNVVEKGNDPNGGKRVLVTIQDIRNSYQKELDRRSVIENGRFGFGDPGEGEDAMDLV